MRNLRVTADEKLRILRQQDPLRNWQSLDDARVCVLCDQSINGHLVKFRKDRNGLVFAACPTRSCEGTPSEWVYPGAGMGTSWPIPHDSGPVPIEMIPEKRSESLRYRGRFVD
jgi:hypothetical protein